MINNYIKIQIQKHLKFQLTTSQSNLFDLFSEFMTKDSENSVFLLKGYAGTGKTTSIGAIVQALDDLKIKNVLMAPTGRAAKVFSNYANKSAYTIHKTIYRQKSSNDGFGSFNLNKNLRNDTIFFVDEASMISGNSGEFSSFGSGNLLEDLLNFVFDGRNCKLVLVGDTAQLPPVGNSESPALDKDTIEYYGGQVMDCFLNDIVRQSSESGILTNASEIRNLINDNDFFDNVPKFDLSGYSDIKRISGEELIEEISSAYDSVGIDNTLIVNRSNKRTNMYNKGIRASILHIEEELTVGDYLLVVKNNYHWLKDNKELDFIANGDIAEIVRIKKYEELYDRRFVNCTIRLIDYKELEVDVKILLDVLQSDAAGLNRNDQEKFFYNVLEDYSALSTRRKQYEAVKTNEYYNALQVKFAYAMTCHKSQGGQWKRVFIDPGYVPEENVNKDYYRWLYTAITRCTEKLYLVNFKDEYFES